MGRLTIAVAVLVLFAVFYKVPGRKFWAKPVGGGGGGAVGIRTCRCRCVVPSSGCAPRVYLWLIPGCCLVKLICHGVGRHTHAGTLYANATPTL